MKLFAILFFTVARAWSYDLEVNTSHVDRISDFYSQNFESLKKIKSTPYYGIEILVAGENKSQMASRFGHSAIRFVGSGATALDDYVVSLEMFTAGASNVYWGALIGGREVFPRVYRLLTYVNTYQVSEARSLQRLLVPASKTKIDALLNLMEKMMTVPDLLGDYNFLTNNCTTALLKLLSAADVISLKFFDHNLFDIPTGLQKRLRQALVSPYPSFSIPSSYQILKRYAESFYKENYSGRRLHIVFDEHDFIQTLVDQSFWMDLNEKLTSEERFFVQVFWPQTALMSMLEKRNAKRAIGIYTKIALAKSLLEKSPAPSMDEMLNSPEALYKICTAEDELCRSDRTVSIQALGLEDSVKHITRDWQNWHRQAESLMESPLLVDFEGRKDFVDWYQFDLTQDMLSLAQEMSSR